MSSDKIQTVAIIGFGEVGGMFGKDLLTSGVDRVATYDILFEREDGGRRLRDKAAQIGVIAADSHKAASEGADLIISCVTAGSARDVAKTVAGFIKPEQVFLDVNSVSPQDKEAGAEAVEAAGGTYVEAAVMSPIGRYGLRVPILLGGKAAAALAERVKPLGMNVRVASDRIGVASAMKMCRSVMVKGLEALMVECLFAARKYGIEDDVLASLKQSYPGIDWIKQSVYNLDRVFVHGKRRAEEMEFSAATVAATGIEPRMTSSIAKVEKWVSELGVAYNPKTDSDKPLGELIDKLIAAAEKNKRP
jgi:3-hydroxyisobutyrate dehydrogenase-like beta-hydroxyacid dehydrogenase